MIYRGTATVSGGVVVLQPPVGGFGGIEGVRLTNYTVDAIVLQNITGDAPGEEQYIMPFQQCVYKVDNVRQPPTAFGLVLGTDFATSALLVEWSNDPLHDFPGTYPAVVQQAPINPANSTDGVVVLAASGTGTIPDGTRRQTTFYNTGPGVVYWSENASTVLGAATSASLNSGMGVTLDGGRTVYLKADASGASVSYFG